MNHLHIKLLKHSSLQYLLKQFKRLKVPEPSSSITIILEHAINQANNQKNNKHSKKKITLAGSSIIKAVKLCKFRKFHYPIQYIVGDWPFRYLNLKLKSPVLIPRYETENLVTLVIELLRKKWEKGSTLKVVDFGCGSGAIGLSLLKQLENEYKFQMTFVDISQQCLKLTKINAVKNQIPLANLNFVLKDMSTILHLIDDYDIVLSNPPYLQEKNYHNLQKQVKLFEAKTALVGGSDGLQLVKPLTQKILSARQKKKMICAIEYGGQDVSQLNSEQYVVSDQYGKRRYLIFP